MNGLILFAHKNEYIKKRKNQESGFEVRKSILDIYKCPF